MGLDNIHVRRCSEADMYDVWVWWNDQVTRAMMERKAYVPFEEHKKWFNLTLQDSKKVLCLGLIRNNKIGVVRFDASDEKMLSWEVSINLNPAFRGKNLGWRFLVSAITLLSTEKKFSVLYANVGESSNVASQRTFQKAGFKLMPDPKYAYHYEFSHANI